MSAWTVRLIRALLWCILLVLITGAVAVTGLRLIFPHLNEHRQAISSWVSEHAGLPVVVGSVSGRWHSLGPSLLLHDVTVRQSEDKPVLVHVGQAELRLDLWRSILHLRPQFETVYIDQLLVDVTHVNFDDPVTFDLEQLFLVRLGDFILQDGLVRYHALSDGTLREVVIPRLAWFNQGSYHRAKGLIQLDQHGESHATLMADLKDSSDIRGSSGTVYLSVDAIDVSPWLLPKLKDRSRLLGGELSAELWLNLTHGQIDSGVLSLLPSHLQWDAQAPHRLDLQAGQIHIQRSDQRWLFDSHDLILTTDGQPWPALHLAAELESDIQRVSINQLDMARLAPLLPLFVTEQRQLDQLDALNPQGKVADIRLQWQADQPTQFSAQLQQLGIDPALGLPGVNRLSGLLAGDSEHGRFALAVNDDIWPTGGQFQAPLVIRELNIKGHWLQQANQWQVLLDQFALRTPELATQLQARLDGGDERSPRLALYGELELNAAKQLWRYLPQQALGQSLTDYLSSAFQDGQVNQGRLLWLGQLAHYPYAQNQGIFAATAQYREGRFNFDSQWPLLEQVALDLRVENATMWLDSWQVETQGVKATRVRGYIDRLTEDGVLTLDIDLAAKGKQVLDYMLASPLVDSVGAALTEVRVEGQVSSQFKITIPFDSRPIGVDGRVQLANNSVTLQTLGLTLAKVKGALHFDQDHLDARGIQGELFGQSVDVAFQGKNRPKDYQLKVQLQGTWVARQLAETMDMPLLDLVEGALPWQLNVGIELFDVGLNYRFNLTGQLANLKSKLPAPLDQLDRPQAELSGQGTQDWLALKLDWPQLKYQAEVALKQKPVISASYLAIGESEFALVPLSGHQIALQQPQLEVTPWLELWHRRPPLAASDDGIALPLPTHVNLKLGQLDYGSMRWHGLNLALRRHGEHWQALFDSREMAGEINWPQSGPVTIQLEQLHLNFPELDAWLEAQEEEPHLHLTDGPVNTQATAGELALYQQLPEMDVSIADAWLQGYKLGQVSGKLRRGESGLSWQEVSILSGKTQLSLAGTWAIRDGEHQTQASLHLTGEDNSELMERFGISSGIQSAHFDIESRLQWQGALWAPKVNTIQGAVSIQLQRGVITSISGAGNLLGLFSLDSIVRKMQLDFSGVFDEGLAFRHIRGSGTFAQGVFLSDNIEMDAIAGQMSLEGWANLNTGMVNAHVRFTPDITSGIPVLTAFAVTPTTAVAVFAITTALTPVLEVITQINYQISGPLADPVVQETSRNQAEITVPEETTRRYQRELNQQKD